MPSKREYDSDTEDTEDAKNRYYEIDEKDGERVAVIHELDPSKLHPTSKEDVKGGSRYIAIGRPGSGKSTLIKFLMYCKRHIFPVAQIHSGTEESNGFFTEYVPSCFIFEGPLDPDNLKVEENFEKRQKYARQYLEPTGASAWCFNVYDDCTDDNKFLKKPVIQRKYKNGRHMRMMDILSLQYALDMPRNIRGCIDGVFIMYEPNPEIRKKIWENFGKSYISNYQDFSDLMDNLQTYEALYINLNTDFNKGSYDLESNVFTIKPDIKKIPKDWKHGANEVWEFHKERFNPNYTSF